MAKKRSRRVGGIDWPIAIPSVSFLGLVVYWVINMARQNAGDRSGYNQAVTDLRNAHAAELNVITARHNETIEDLREQINLLRDEIKGLRQELEAERKARHEAEDEAVHYRRLAGGDEANEPNHTS